MTDHPFAADADYVKHATGIPGMFSRGGFGGGLPRCTGCCRALRYPVGNGSPKNDDRIRPLIGLD